MNKYIIKNCPAFILMRRATSGTYFDMCGNAKGHIKCADCTDCVMKQTVELCKEESSIMQHKQKIKVKGLNKLADKILELLNIQKVE